MVAAVTLLVFAPSLENDFVGWDDPVLFTQNEQYRGLGPAQLAWMFSTTLMGHYVPVTWLTHGLDYVLWQMRPAGYHLTNVLLHVATTALFYLAVLRLLPRTMPVSRETAPLAAAASALFFALHPLRVESVAWITERRGVLSGFLFMLTLFLYVLAVDGQPRATDRGSPPEDAGRRRTRLLHAAACLSYGLAIFSKSIVMTLPAILVLLDVYPFRRLNGDWRAWARPPAWLVWREKIPYAALGGLAAIVAVWAQATGAAFTSPESLGVTTRPVVVAHSLWFYLVKTLMPFGLSPLYEPPARIDPLAPQFLVPAIAAGGVVTVLLAVRRRWPAGLAVLLGYAILLAPVSGLVHAGNQLTHDRYSYLAGLPISLLAGAGVGLLLGDGCRARLRPGLRAAMLASVAGWLLALGATSALHVQTWKNDESLWRQAVDSRPDCSICEVNLGAALLRDGLARPAIARFERALALRPDRVNAHLNLGLALADVGELGRAVEELRWVLAHHPDHLEALGPLGSVLARQGRHAEGLALLRVAERHQPHDPRVLSSLGLVLLDAGHAAEAIAVLERAVQADPRSAASLAGLAAAHRAAGDEARAHALQQTLAGLDSGLAARTAPATVPTW